MLMNKAMTGSVTADCTPQLTQLFVMGLGLFSTPLNVSTLIEWLNMPVHPIDRYFREKLAEAIVTEGGYRNEACRKLIKAYIDGKFVFLEIGVGFNTPGIIRYPFEQMTYNNDDATLIRRYLDYPQAIEENKDKTISFDEDVEEILDYWLSRI